MINLEIHPDRRGRRPFSSNWGHYLQGSLSSYKTNKKIAPQKIISEICYTEKYIWKLIHNIITIDRCG